MRIAALVLVTALAAPVAVTAQEEQPSLLEQAERLAADVVLPAPTHQRSMLRTSIGLGMVGSGIAMMLLESRPESYGEKEMPLFLDDPFMLDDADLTPPEDAGDDLPMFDDDFGNDDLFSDGRNPWLRYGGAALAIGGAALSTFWSDVPVLRNLQVTPVRRGAAVGGTVGF